MVYYNVKEKKLDKRIETYEKQISWNLILIFLVSSVLIYQLIFNCIFAPQIYNPALGDIPVQYEETKKGKNPDASSQEPKVIIWREKKGDVTRSVNDVPTICGVQLPQFCFIAIIAALGLGMYNIRALLLKEFVLKLKDDLLNQDDGRG